MQVSKSEFARIKSLARKAKRAEKVSETAQLAIRGGIPGPTAAQGAPESSNRRPSRPKRATGKPRPLSVKNQIKAIKKRILGTGGLWSQAVRRRDRACIMCKKVEGLQAHHWLIRRSHSMALAVDIANGATLCYSCHIGRAHREADADFILALTARMAQIVGDAKIAEMREKAKHPAPLSLDFWQEAEQTLKNLLSNTLTNRISLL